MPRNHAGSAFPIEVSRSGVIHRLTRAEPVSGIVAKRDHLRVRLLVRTHMCSAAASYSLIQIGLDRFILDDNVVSDLKDIVYPLVG
jgi:hypothetical protein